MARLIKLDVSKLYELGVADSSVIAEAIVENAKALDYEVIEHYVAADNLSEPDSELLRKYIESEKDENVIKDANDDLILIDIEDEYAYDLILLRKVEE